MRFLFIVAGLCVLPLFGLGAAIFAAAETPSMAGLQLSARYLAGCARELTPDPRLTPCGASTDAARLALLSVATLAGSFLLIAGSRILSLVLGVHRSVLALGFRPVAIVLTLGVALAALGHLAVGIGGLVAITQKYAALSPSVVWAASGAILVGAAVVLGRTMRGFFAIPRSFVAARPISLYEYPRLGLLVRDISKTLKARMPDNVVIGLEPNFFATTVPLNTPYLRGPLRGQTLHLSLSLMSLFTEGELRAVIGHELGHFSGEDTLYTQRFAPAFMGLYRAHETLLAKERPVTRILGFPARLMIEDILRGFSIVESRIRRAREHRADISGVSVSSSDDLSYSLLKSSVLGSVWHEQMQSVIERGQRGSFSRNIVRNFSERVRLDVEREKISPLIRFALGETIRHPTDSHPTTEERLAAFNIDLDAVCKEELLLERFFTARKVTEGLDNMTALEEDLTSLQYHLYQSLWPKEEDGRNVDDVFMSLLCDFLALMVTIDGSADDREVAQAETRAKALFGGFDTDGFRDRCLHPQHIPALDNLIAFAAKMLTPTGVTNLKTVLRQIAEADGVMHPAEQDLLQQIDARLIPEESA